MSAFSVESISVRRLTSPDNHQCIGSILDKAGRTLYHPGSHSATSHRFGHTYRVFVHHGNLASGTQNLTAILKRDEPDDFIAFSGDRCSAFHRIIMLTRDLTEYRIPEPKRFFDFFISELSYFHNLRRTFYSSAVSTEPSPDS